MLHRNFIRAGVAAMAILFTTAFNNNVLAAPIFADGDFITYTQEQWDTSASAFFLANYATVYAPSFAVEVGIPGPGVNQFSIRFTNSSAVLTYLPSIGPDPLIADATDPNESEVAGSFGSDVLSLQLDVDFSDAGVMLGALGIPFGDLVLTNFSTLPLLNGSTVRQYLSLANTVLGGGTGIYTRDLLAATTDSLTNAFVGGVASQFAEDHLRYTQTPTPVPEPATAGLVLLGLLALGRVRRHSRV